MFILFDVFLSPLSTGIL